MGLERFVKGGAIEFNSTEDRRDKVALIFDAHNLIFRTLFVAHHEDPTDVEFKYWKTLMLQSINAATKKHKPGRLILALDKGDSWRKEVYNLYKDNRKAGRDVSPIDFEKFFPICESFFEEFKKAFPNSYVMKCPRCEGDDIIAILVRDILPDWRCICISTDRDMYQLYKYSNYSQYDPIKKNIVKCINPKQYLLVKIIMGDKGDNVPAIADRVGPKTAEKMMKDLIKELSDPEKAKNFERNKILIDFDCIPDDIVTIVKECFNSYPIQEFKGRALMDFFVRVGSNGLVAYLQEYVTNFKPLI